MRLIDADKWINKLETQMNDKDCPSEIKDYNQLMINEIGSEPTAYDVDKVIDEVRGDCYSMGFDESQTEIIVDDIRAKKKEVKGGKEA